MLWSSYIYATAFLGLMLRMLEMLDITYTLGPLEGAISKMMTVYDDANHLWNIPKMQYSTH